MKLYGFWPTYSSSWLLYLCESPSIDQSTKQTILRRWHHTTVCLVALASVSECSRLLAFVLL